MVLKDAGEKIRSSLESEFEYSEESQLEMTDDECLSKEEKKELDELIKEDSPEENKLQKLGEVLQNATNTSTNNGKKASISEEIKSK